MWQYKRLQKSLGPFILEKQGTEGVLDTVFRYSSLIQPSYLHRHDKPWDDMPRLEGWSASKGLKPAGLRYAGYAAAHLKYSSPPTARGC